MAAFTPLNQIAIQSEVRDEASAVVTVHELLPATEIDYVDPALLDQAPSLRLGQWGYCGLSLL